MGIEGNFADHSAYGIDTIEITFRVTCELDFGCQKQCRRACRERKGGQLVAPRRSLNSKVDGSECLELTAWEVDVSCNMYDATSVFMLWKAAVRARSTATMATAGSSHMTQAGRNKMVL